MMHLKLIDPPDAEPITLDEAKLHLKVDAAADNALITRHIKAARKIGEKETNRAFITQTWQLCHDVEPGIIEIPKPPLQSISHIKTISAVESYVDVTSNTGQPVLSVADTDGFAVDDTVVIDRGGDREEEVTILSIQDGISLTMTTNLTKAHTDTQADIVAKFILTPRISYYVDRPDRAYGRVILAPGHSWPIHRGFASFIVEFVCGFGGAGTDVPEELREGLFLLLGYMYENRGGGGVVSEKARSYFTPHKVRTF